MALFLLRFTQIVFIPKMVVTPFFCLNRVDSWRSPPFQTRWPAFRDIAGGSQFRTLSALLGGAKIGNSFGPRKPIPVLLSEQQLLWLIAR